MAKRYQQPQGSARIDWGNPIARGLTIAFIGSNLTTNLALRTPIAKIGSTSRSATKDGIAGFFTASTDDGLSLGNDNRYNPAEMTLFAIGAMTSQPSNDSSMFISRDDNSLGRAFSLDLHSQTGFGVRYYVNGGGNVGINELSDTVATTLGRRYVVAATQKGASAILYVDGAAVSSSSSFQSIPSTTGDTQIGRRSYSGFTQPFDGAIPVVLQWNRALSPSEVASISANPWQLFSTTQRTLRAFVAGGAATVIPIGVSAAGSAGTPTATGAANAVPSGVNTTAAVGTPTAAGGTSIAATALPVGLSAAASVGAPVAKGEALAISGGVGVTASVGTPVAFGGTQIPATVTPAGVSALAYVGAVSANGSAGALPVGVQAIGNIGAFIANGEAWCYPIGVQAVASVGSPTAYIGFIEVYIPGAMAGSRATVNGTRQARTQAGGRPSQTQKSSRPAR